MAKVGSSSLKSPSSALSYKDMIVEAVSYLNERRGTSRQAITRYLVENNGIDHQNKAALRKITTTLVQLLEDGVLLQTSSHGASGSFKVAKEVPKKAAPKEIVPKKTDDKEDDAESTSDVENKQPPTMSKSKTALVLKPKRNSGRVVAVPLSVKKMQAVRRSSRLANKAVKVEEEVKHDGPKKTAEKTTKKAVKLPETKDGSTVSSEENAKALKKRSTRSNNSPKKPAPRKALAKKAVKK